MLKDVARAVAVFAIVLLAAASESRRPPRRRKLTPAKRPTLTRLPPHVNLELYCATMRHDGGQDAILLLARGLEWMEQWGGWTAFGKGPHAPLYLVIPDRAAKPVKALCFHTTEGDIGVLYRYLKNHPPFDAEDARRDLTIRLNAITGISIPPGRWNGRAYYVKPAVLGRPAAADVFFEIFNDVAERLQAPLSQGSET